MQSSDGKSRVLSSSQATGNQRARGKSHLIIYPKQKERKKTDPEMVQTTGERWVLTAGVERAGSPCCSTHLTHLVETATPSGGGKCTAGQGLAQPPLIEKTASSSMTLTSIVSGYMFSCKELPRDRGEAVWPGTFRDCLSLFLPFPLHLSVLCSVCVLYKIQNTQGEQIYGSCPKADISFLQLSLNHCEPLFMRKSLSS